MALTDQRDTQELDSAFSQQVSTFGSASSEAAVDAAVTIYKGALVCFDTASGTIKPGVASTTLIALGRAENDVLGSDPGDCRVRSGAFGYDNSTAGDLIANTDAGSVCYVVDDEQVALTDGGGTRSEAGKIVKVDAAGQVFVAINPLS